MFRSFIRSQKILQKIELSKQQKIIKHFPICSRCSFYNMEDGTCSKFGEKDFITGEIINYPVEKCRKEPLLCGTEGNHYSEMNNFEKGAKRAKYLLSVSCSVSTPFIIYFSFACLFGYSIHTLHMKGY